jgi:hypothetical protein
VRFPIAVFLILAVSTAAHADGIVNGDFDGDFGSPPAAPWVITGNVQIWPDNTDPGSNSRVARLALGNSPASLSQSFDCGDAGPNKVCTVGAWFRWAPNAGGDDPGHDESFEIRDGGVVVFSRTFAEPVLEWTPLVLAFGDCGSQTITFEINDPSDNTLESGAFVDLGTCSCDEPVPTGSGTWGRIKSLYRTP